MILIDYKSRIDSDRIMFSDLSYISPRRSMRRPNLEAVSIVDCVIKPFSYTNAAHLLCGRISEVSKAQHQHTTLVEQWVFEHCRQVSLSSWRNPLFFVSQTHDHIDQNVCLSKTALVLGSYDTRTLKRLSEFSCIMIRDRVVESYFPFLPSLPVLQ